MINKYSHRVTCILRSKWWDIIDTFQNTFKHKIWGKSNIYLVVLLFILLNFVNKSNQQNFKTISINKCHL